LIFELASDYTFIILLLFLLSLPFHLHAKTSFDFVLQIVPIRIHLFGRFLAFPQSLIDISQFAIHALEFLSLPMKLSIGVDGNLIGFLSCPESIF